jgi:hypothetical protein
MEGRGPIVVGNRSESRGLLCFWRRRQSVGEPFLVGEEACGNDGSGAAGATFSSTTSMNVYGVTSQPTASRITFFQRCWTVPTIRPRHPGNSTASSPTSMVGSSDMFNGPSLRADRFLIHKSLHLAGPPNAEQTASGIMEEDTDSTVGSVKLLLLKSPCRCTASRSIQQKNIFATVVEDVPEVGETDDTLGSFGNPLSRGVKNGLCG